MVVMRHVPSFHENVIPVSYLAVDLFFLLSGVVIANAYEAKLADGRATFEAFFSARLIRIMPLYLVGSLIGLASLNYPFFGNGNFILSLLLTPLMLPNFYGPALYQFNYPAWSLFFEFCANALYGAVGFRLSDRSLMAIAVACFAILIFAASTDAKVLDVGWTRDNFVFGFPRVIFSFVVGVLIWRAHDRRPSRPITSSSLSLILVTLICGVLAAPAETRLSQAVLGLLAIGIIFPLGVHLALRLEPGVRMTKSFEALGVVSYPIYVLHVPLYMLAGHWIAALPMELKAFGIIFALAGATAISLVFDRFVDRPLRAYLTHARSVFSLRPQDRIAAAKEGA